MNFLDILRGKQQVIPPEDLGNVIQIWEFFQRFHKVLQISRDFTINQLYDESKSQEKTTDLLEFLISSMLQYTFKEIIYQKSHNSNYFSILELVQSPGLRKFLIQKTWPLFFANLSKITKMRNVLQEEIKEEYQKFCQLLHEGVYVEFSLDIKFKLILFLINWIVYEIEAFGTDINEVEDMLDVVKVNLSDKQKYHLSIHTKRKQWQIQQKKSEGLIQANTDQIKKEKRKTKKNKKYIDQLEAELLEYKVSQRKYTKLLEFNPSSQETNSRCQCVGSFDSISVWYVEFDKYHFYLRCTDNDTDKWYQVPSQDIFLFIEQLSGHQQLAQSLNQLISDEIIIPSQQKQVTTRQLQYFNFGEEIEYLIENKFNLDFLKIEENDVDLLLKIRTILLQTEDDYSQYEIKYWRCCWQSRDKRKTWRQNVQEVDDLYDLQAIVAKFPHQLSFVNRKHALLEIKEEDSKYKSFRCINHEYQQVYWFYQNKLYSQPYQQLSKGSIPDLQMMFLLTVTLYEKLKFYINKKIIQIELKQIRQNFSSNDESKEIQKSDSKSEGIQLTNRLRSRNQYIVYDEKKIFDTSSKKTTIKKAAIKSEETSPNLSVKDLEEFQYTGDRQLRIRKKVKYN